MIFGFPWILYSYAWATLISISKYEPGIVPSFPDHHAAPNSENKEGWKKEDIIDSVQRHKCTWSCRQCENFRESVAFATGWIRSNKATCHFRDPTPETGKFGEEST
jgi:hypothetical protein